MGYEDTIDLKRLAAIIGRQKGMIAMIAGGLLAVALVYVLVAPPLYTAKTELLLDKSVTATVSDISPIKQMGFEKSAIDSEVEVIGSRRVTHAAKQLLEKNGMLVRFAQGAGLDPQSTDEDDLAQKLVKGMDVSRVGETYVLSISYTFGDPNVAAAVANAYAEAYISEQLDALGEVSTRTVSWLETRIDELGKQAIDAKKAVSDFRTSYNEMQRALTSIDPATLTPEQAAKNRDASEGGLGKLRTLEQEEKTYSTLYDTYLEKLQKLSMQQSYPVTETRIITYAAPPKSKSHPRATLILGAALIFGFSIGIMAAILRDNFDRSLRRAGQIRREIDAAFLGFFPERRKSRMKALEFSPSRGRGPVPVLLYGQSVDDPFSLQCETVRTIRNAIDSRLADSERSTGKVIGIASPEPFDGTLVVASNLALYIAQSSPCLLIDADLRGNAPFSGDGRDADVKTLSSVLLGEVPLKEALLHQQKPGQLSLLPSLAGEAAQTLPHLNAGSAGRIIEECRKHFDYTFVNLPPMLAPADFYSFAQAMDGFVIVAEWGRTLPNALNFYLGQNGIAPEKILGVVLENADMRRMEKHYGHKIYAA